MSEVAVATVGVRRWADWVTLTKPRISLLALFTVAAGYVLAVGRAQDLQLAQLWHVLLGAGLVASAGGVVNQLLERRYDACMRRTQQRPLPAGRISPRLAAAYGATLLGMGLIWLWATTTAIATLIAVATFALYVGVYTPLKRLSAWNTLVGAIPGALPPLIGWYAVPQTQDWLSAVGLFAILFFWQIPHFMAIAWRYRQEYAAAGFRMLPNNDPAGRRTAAVSLLSCAVLLVSGVALAWHVHSVWVLWGALLAGLWFLGSALRFAWRRCDDRARGLLHGSLLYVPVVYGFLVLDVLLR
jgi:protoheme IX farnesyltransferase